MWKTESLVFFMKLEQMFHLVIHKSEGCGVGEVKSYW